MERMQAYNNDCESLFLANGTRISCENAQMLMILF